MSLDKSKIATQVKKLADSLGVHGVINTDGQSLFLAQAINLILVAAADPKDAMILTKHLLRATEELAMANGDAEMSSKILASRAREKQSLN
jgi:hypothetical protein